MLALAAAVWVALAAAGAAAAAPEVRLTQVRLATHAGFTRLVLDLTGAVEWRVESDALAGLVRLLLPGAREGGGVRGSDARGWVRGVRVVADATGLEVRVQCAPGVEVRTQALTAPDRIVVDLVPGEAALRGAGAVPAGPEEGSEENLLPPSMQRVRSGPVAAAGGEEAAGTPATSGPAGGGGPGVRERARPERVGMTIVLDPGHGGHDTGALGPTGLAEKEIVLDLALRLAPLLRSRLGMRVLLTRSEDVFVPLADRTAFANRAKADLFVSLHLNGAGRRDAAGVETFFFTREPSDNDARASAQRENLVVEVAASPHRQDALLRSMLADMAVTRDMKEASALAESLLVALDAVLTAQNRGVKSGPFYVLATAAMPAVLVESAFITNPQEERRLRSDAHRQRIAEALFDGIARYKAGYDRRLGMSWPRAASGS